MDGGNGFDTYRVDSGDGADTIIVADGQGEIVLMANMAGSASIQTANTVRGRQVRFRLPGARRRADAVISSKRQHQAFELQEWRVGHQAWGRRQCYLGVDSRELLDLWGGNRSWMPVDR
jgi:hypothetical protein